MATITPGTGGTCKSSTAEGQLVEILSFIGLAQADTSKNLAGVTNINATHNQQTRIYAGSYRFDVIQAITGDGHLELEAQSFLINTGFTPGTDGTFKGNTPEKYALEVLMYLQQRENIPGNNPDNRNFISGTFNSDNGRYDGAFSVPVAYSLDPTTGAVIYTASPYLN